MAWLNKVIEAYHRDAKGYILSEKDRFLNPIGSTYLDSLGKILDWLFGDSSAEMVIPHLLEVLRIGCLHGYSPNGKTYTGLLKSSLDELPEIFESSHLGLISERLKLLSLVEEKVYVQVKEKLESLRKEGPKVYQRLKNLDD